MDYEEDHLIEQTRLCQLDELASDRWLLHHQAVVQLSLKAVSQTAQLCEETVYAKLMVAEKVRATHFNRYHWGKKKYFKLYFKSP